MASVVAGLAATSLAFWVFFFAGPGIFPFLYPAGSAPIGAAQDLRPVLAALLVLAFLLLTFFLGGLAAGVVASASPGRHGALGTALAAFGAFAWFAMPLVPFLWDPDARHAEVYVPNEGLGTLLAAGAGFCALLPLAVLGGYLGGRAGGRLRAGSSPTSGP